MDHQEEDHLELEKQLGQVAEAVKEPLKMQMLSLWSGPVSMTQGLPALKYRMKRIWNTEAKLTTQKIAIMNF